VRCGPEFHPYTRDDMFGVQVSVRGTGAGGVGSHGSTGVEILPSLALCVLSDWKQRCAMHIFVGGLSFSAFHSPEWRSFFLIISGGRFSRPGDPRNVAGASLDAASAKVMAHVDAAVRGAYTVAVTVDVVGSVNGNSAYRVMVCLPKPLLPGSL